MLGQERQVYTSRRYVILIPGIFSSTLLQLRVSLGLSYLVALSNLSTRFGLVDQSNSKPFATIVDLNILASMPSQTSLFSQYWRPRDQYLRWERFQGRTPNLSLTRYIIRLVGGMSFTVVVLRSCYTKKVLFTSGINLGGTRGPSQILESSNYYSIQLLGVSNGVGTCLLKIRRDVRNKTTRLGASSSQVSRKYF